MPLFLSSKSKNKKSTVIENAISFSASTGNFQNIQSNVIESSSKKVTANNPQQSTKIRRAYSKVSDLNNNNNQFNPIRLHNNEVSSESHGASQENENYNFQRELSNISNISFLSTQSALPINTNTRKQKSATLINLNPTPGELVPITKQNEKRRSRFGFLSKSGNFAHSLRSSFRKKPSSSSSEQNRSESATKTGKNVSSANLNQNNQRILTNVLENENFVIMNQTEATRRYEEQANIMKSQSVMLRASQIPLDMTPKNVAAPALTSIDFKRRAQSGDINNLPPYLGVKLSQTTYNSSINPFQNQNYQNHNQNQNHENATILNSRPKSCQLLNPPTNFTTSFNNIPSVYGQNLVKLSQDTCQQTINQRHRVESSNSVNFNYVYISKKSFIGNSEMGQISEVEAGQKITLLERLDLSNVTGFVRIANLKNGSQGLFPVDLVLSIKPVANQKSKSNYKDLDETPPKIRNLDGSLRNDNKVISSLDQNNNHLYFKKQIWNHDNLTRDQAEAKLRRHCIGSFLIRENHQKDNVLSVKAAGSNNFMHYRIKKIPFQQFIEQGRNENENENDDENTNNQILKKKVLHSNHFAQQKPITTLLTIDSEDFFVELDQLILYYQSDANGLCHKLTLPVVGDIPETEIEVIEKLGIGEFSKVYRAMIPESSDSFAIKCAHLTTRKPIFNTDSLKIHEKSTVDSAIGSLELQNNTVKTVKSLSPEKMIDNIQTDDKESADTQIDTLKSNNSKASASTNHNTKSLEKSFSSIEIADQEKLKFDTIKNEALERWSQANLLREAAIHQLICQDAGRFGASCQNLVQIYGLIRVKSVKYIQDELRAVSDVNRNTLLNNVLATSSPMGIILEYLPKGSLNSVLRNQGRKHLKNLHLLDFSLDICRASRYLLERHNIIHRDLATRNVLVTENNVAKLCDFGMAVVLSTITKAYELNGNNFDGKSSSDEEANVTNVTNPTTNKSSTEPTNPSTNISTKKYSTFKSHSVDSNKLPLRWIAPEAYDTCIFSELTEIWSFGVTLWEIFTYGRVPYGRVKSEDVIEKIKSNTLSLDAKILENLLEGEENSGSIDQEVYQMIGFCCLLNVESRVGFEGMFELLSRLRLVYYLRIRGYRLL